MSENTDADDACTVFAIDQPDTERADVYVDGTFENRYGDQRAYLAGDTYDAKDVIKFDWETTHHDFDSASKRWVVDVAALDELAERLADAGFSFAADPQADADDALVRFHAYVEEGDDIEVTYAQKNGNGQSSFAGAAVDVGYNSGYEDKPMVAFRRHDDDHYMYVQYDKFGKVALYTGGSTNPFVGAVDAICVAADRPLPADDETDDSDESERSDATDEPLPWE